MAEAETQRLVAEEAKRVIKKAMLEEDEKVVRK